MSNKWNSPIVKSSSLFNEKTKIFPTYVMFDITGLCNLRCIHCPQKYKYINKITKSSKAHMDFEIFKRAIDEIAKKEVDFVRITGNGEPLLHPEFLDFIRYARRKISIPVTITTNGQLLNTEMSEKIIDFKVDVIDISIDAFTKETYETVRRKGDFCQLMVNIFSFIRLKKIKKSKIKIILSFVEQKLNNQEKNDFVKFWSPLVDEVLIRQQHTMGGKINAAINKIRLDRYPCPHLWKRIVVERSGALSYCPVDMFSKTIIGDYPHSTIEQIWRGLEYEELREAHVLGNYEKHIGCGSCDDWKTSSWDLGYDTLIKRIMRK